jgi:uncharacterized membrane protein YbaN (DUF454 family)
VLRMHDEKIYPEQFGYGGRLWWRMLAGAGVFLAVVGAFLPVMPTVPFLLVAAWAAKRGAPELYDRLHQHHVWGPSLRNWRDQRAISKQAKTLALVSMAASWFLLWFLGAALPVRIVMALVFICVSLFILSRPSPQKAF